MIVYLVRSVENGRCYIGKTTRSLSARWHEHIRDARNSRKSGDLYRDIRLHGKDRFAIEVLAEATCQRRLAQLERKFIRLYRATEEGYNQDAISHGGKIRNYSSRPIRIPQSQRDRIAESVRRFHEERRRQGGNAEVAA